MQPVETNIFFSILRLVLMNAGTYAAARGWIDDATWQTISGAVITLAVAGWSIYVTRQKNAVVKAVQP